jgi:hypothetical protein
MSSLIAEFLLGCSLLMLQQKIEKNNIALAPSINMKNWTK